MQQCHAGIADPGAWRVEHTRVSRDESLSPDARFLASADNRSLTVRSTAHGEVVRSWALPVRLLRTTSPVAWQPNGQSLAVQAVRPGYPAPPAFVLLLAAWPAGTWQLLELGPSTVHEHYLVLYAPCGTKLAVLPSSLNALEFVAPAFFVDPSHRVTTTPRPVCACASWQWSPDSSLLAGLQHSCLSLIHVASAFETRSVFGRGTAEGIWGPSHQPLLVLPAGEAQAWLLDCSVAQLQPQLQNLSQGSNEDRLVAGMSLIAWRCHRGLQSAQVVLYRVRDTGLVALKTLDVPSAVRYSGLLAFSLDQRHLAFAQLIMGRTSVLQLHVYEASGDWGLVARDTLLCAGHVILEELVWSTNGERLCVSATHAANARPWLAVVSFV